MMTPKDTRIAVRVSAVLRGQLLEEAGDYGTLSTVVRVILENHFNYGYDKKKQARNGGRR